MTKIISKNYQKKVAKFSFFNITLEDKQSSSQDEELERLQKENDDLQEINQDLENQIDELKQKEEQLKERIAELEEIGEEVTEKDTELNRLTGSLTSLSNFYFIFLFRRNRFTYFKNQPVWAQNQRTRWSYLKTSRR